MFLFGLIFRLLIEMYIHPGMGLGALVGGVYVSSRVLDVGSAASLTLGALPWSILLMALIHVVVQLGEIDAMWFDSRAQAGAKARTT